MPGDDSLENALGLIDIIAIANAKGHVDAASVAGSRVGDGVATDFAVGHNHQFVVKRTHSCREHVHRVDDAADPAGLNAVTHIKWLIGKDEQPMGKV